MKEILRDDQITIRLTKQEKEQLLQAVKLKYQIDLPPSFGTRLILMEAVKKILKSNNKPRKLDRSTVP